ncbi:hypothetical protein SDC9_157691 [bioreactor metagenome]|uniref:Uncharacterized protein n=1 Tax=bioreactor metagenome TaxID=1076179 RepID=A0A645F9V0_9ZZZZ
MPAKSQCNYGHHQQRQNLQAHAFGTDKYHQQQERNNQRR